jgi:hypothetical protein
MITLEQLNMSNKIIAKIDKLNGILRGFDSPYVQTSVGLLGLYQQSTGVKACEDAGWFMKNMDGLTTQLNNLAKDSIIAEVEYLNSKLSALILMEEK